MSRSLLAIVALNADAALAGRRDQPAELIIGQDSSGVSDIGVYGLHSPAALRASVC